MDDLFNDGSFMYTDETRKVIIKRYKKEIVGLSMSAMQMMQHKVPNGGVLDSDELQKMFLTAVSGAFILGFKTGNDLFLDDVDKKEEKKEEK